VDSPIPRAILLSTLALGCSLAQNSVTVVSAASYFNGPQENGVPGNPSVAPGSIVSMFASNIATRTTVATNPPPAPLPTNLDGVSATITDASGNTQPIRLIEVTPGQINAVLPSGLQAQTCFALCSGPGLNPDTAVVNVTTSTGNHISGEVNLLAVSPGLFSADQTGTWLAAAQVVTTHADGSQTYMDSIATCTSNLVWNGYTWSGCVPVPVDVGTGTDQVVLELFGTGIRGANAIAETDPQYANGPGVSVIAGPVCSNANPDCNYLEVLYAGPQGARAPGSFYGLDQVNVVLPPSLAGSGVISLTVEAVAGYVGADCCELVDSNNAVYVYIK
jgi:uncharacterized protein (TIGR03437 family)